jgi:hypothetical protein
MEDVAKAMTEAESHTVDTVSNSEGKNRKEDKASGCVRDVSQSWRSTRLSYPPAALEAKVF